MRDVEPEQPDPLFGAEPALSDPFGAVYYLPAVVICLMVAGVSVDHLRSFNVETLLRS